MKSSSNRSSSSSGITGKRINNKMRKQVSQQHSCSESSVCEEARENNESQQKLSINVDSATVNQETNRDDENDKNLSQSKDVSLSNGGENNSNTDSLVSKETTNLLPMSISNAQVSSSELEPTASCPNQISIVERVSTEERVSTATNEISDKR